MIMMYMKALHAIENDKFNILDVIRQGTSKQNFPITLSIGIAYDDIDLNKLTDQHRVTGFGWAVVFKLLSSLVMVRRFLWW